jgi:hypothetical protein
MHCTGMSTGTCFIKKEAPSSSLLQGKHLPFTSSPLRLNIFRLFVILSLTQLYRYTLPRYFSFRRIQDVKIGEGQLKKLRRAEGGAKNVGVFRVKNHDFTPKNHIFPILGVARARCASPWIRPCNQHNVSMGFKLSPIYKLKMTSQVDKFVHKETE